MFQRLRSNFEKPTSKNLQCAVLESWMLLICRKLHWLPTAGSCCSLCDTGFVWQLQSFLFQHSRQEKKIKRLAFETCLKASSALKQQKGREEGNKGWRCSSWYHVRQEIVRGHICFITVMSSFHLLLAACSPSLIAVYFTSKKSAPLWSTTPPNDTTEGKKTGSQTEEKWWWRFAWLMRGWQKQMWLFAYILTPWKMNQSAAILKVPTLINP